ncbi:shikimate dehydrogenase [Nioella sediminis]|jgi:shikimate dehydrogenase|uniref:shikimate dehydrogenase n=1 Tax=Nioella sediminis TaxID=1912092 RepID=UPI0008FD5CC6|nr:shikimate dehydrogenase [Nioella sediminis]TBX16196.1 shikimate dehydrogenase [Roseovarius sp. JS7-11]
MTEKLLLAGVIGDPIAHSRSPRLHGHWLWRYGIDGHYVPLHVTRERLHDTLRLLPDLGFKGVNVTIPHKETVLQIADSVTDRAALIGAANTLTYTANGKLQADNTDGVGFMENIRQYTPGWSASEGPALVLGAGGAARAVVSALLSDGCPHVFLVNRTRARAEALQDHFGAKVHVADWTRIPNVLDEVALLVNTTSLGMVGKQPLHIDLDRLNPATVVNDIVYTPLRTELLEEAAARGCHTVDGLGMLLHQAAPGFERWFGVKPEVDDDLRAVVLGE